jgi:hypothetical protein
MVEAQIVGGVGCQRIERCVARGGQKCSRRRPLLSTPSPRRGRNDFLLAEFSIREMVDCDASGSPVSGQRPTTTFITGSCRRRSRSIASSLAIADERAITISIISCWMRSGLRRSGIAAASRAHTPTLRSAARRSSKPPSDDWAQPLKSTVSFLRQTAGRSKGSGVSSVMAAVALGWDARRIRLDNDSLSESRTTPAVTFGGVRERAAWNGSRSRCVRIAKPVRDVFVRVMNDTQGARTRKKT